jgi:3',5'-cyclic AMP phosphodiesterase CpdA
MGLLQISDPHFGTEVPRVVDALTALTKRLAPSVVVMSGDVTQRATVEQFKLAGDFLRGLPVPVKLVVPGNHDVPLVNLALRAFAPFSRFNKVFGDELEPVHDEAQLLVIGVNSVMPQWHQQGSVSARQIERVCRRLKDASPDQVRIVVCHHPVHVIRAEDDKNLLRNADDAVRSWVDAGADLILGGHIHLPYFRPLKHRYPDLPRAAWVAQAGTAVSSRIRSGIANSVNYIQPSCDDNGLTCRVERWDYSERDDLFRQIAAEDLALDRRTESAVAS